ncbi:MAG: molybdopterin-synthase adenylyltransferase MoeB [Bacteroidota bacterium]
MNFSKEEVARYSRHLVLPEFNITGQRKLKNARVLVVGAGGLGAPLLQYLTAAGVGTLGIVDFDVVEESNLQRQVLFSEDDIGKPKAQAALEKLEKLNRHIKLTAYQTRLHSQNALDIIKDYDIVADGTDNFATRYLINDACVILGKVNVYGSVYGFEGQVSVFNHPKREGHNGPNYRDLFPSPPPPDLVPNCAEGGVIGVLPGIIGSLQASEVIKVITGIGELLSGKLFLFDALRFETKTVKIRKNESQKPIQELIDYDLFCEVGKNDRNETKIKQITPKELHQLILENKDFQLIDVREPHEYEIVNIQGTLIPSDMLDSRMHEISTEKQVVLHCKSGTRSAKAIQYLENEYGFKNLYNLNGGIQAYSDNVDQTLPKY